MELIQIGEQALKVTLTREDMEYYAISFEALDYSNRETRNALHRILEEAKRTLGFEAPREKLYIQAFSDMHGGCELFVRRAGKEECTEGVLCRFAGMRELLLVCGRLANCGYGGESTAYVDDGGRYYLQLHTAPLFLSEMGVLVDVRAEYLGEHAVLLCENAVQTLGALR